MLEAVAQPAARKGERAASKSAYAANLGRGFASNTVSQYSHRPADRFVVPEDPCNRARGQDPIGIAVRPLGVPASKARCKSGGWQNSPRLKNQGQCIKFSNHKS
jgi:hypothetical protein